MGSAKRIIAAIAIVFLVFWMVAFATRLIQPLLFWMVLAGVAILAFWVIPQMKD